MKFIAFLLFLAGPILHVESAMAECDEPGTECACLNPLSGLGLKFSSNQCIRAAAGQCKGKCVYFDPESGRNVILQSCTSQPGTTGCICQTNHPFILLESYCSDPSLPHNSCVGFCSWWDGTSLVQRTHCTSHAAPVD